MYDEMKDDGAPDVTHLATRTRTARKRHVCGACGKAIDPGEKYAVTVEIIDGEFSAEKHHPGMFCIYDSE